MRMHRGSSKGARAPPRPPEALPLSASPVLVRVTVELARAAPQEPRSVTVPSGSQVREVLKRLGLAPEGSAVLKEGVSVPLDLALESDVRLTVVPTFSGG